MYKRIERLCEIYFHRVEFLGRPKLPALLSVCFPLFSETYFISSSLTWRFSRRSCIFIESICMATGSDLFYLSGLTVGNRITISLNGESVLCGP